MSENKDKWEEFDETDNVNVSEDILNMAALRYHTTTKTVLKRKDITGLKKAILRYL